MAHSRERATCCAGSWMTCNQATKRIQHQRLGEAVATGGELLVTACPKCMVHLKCAQSGNEKDSVKIEIRDLAALVADALKEK
jgi:heterodisulfide reductase subunit D